LVVAFFIASCGSCYMAAFHAWLTATPLNPEQLAAHQRFFYYWLVATTLASLAAVGVLVWRRKPQDTSRQD
jgi:hypothetical protein